MDKPRMLIIGARGLLGGYVVKAAEATNAFEIIHGQRTSKGGAGVVELNLSDSSSVAKAFELTRPNLVLLLAAMSDIDQCERLPEEAFAINTLGVKYVGTACIKANARLLFTSTAAVFNGTKQCYTEEDAVSPSSVYGRSKALAESLVQSITPTAVVLRFPLMLGFAKGSSANGLLDTLARKWKAGETVSLSTRETRNPIDALSLGSIAINLLTDREASGIFHAGATESISRYELGLRLAARMGLPPNLVCPQTAPVPGRAPRGEHHFLLTDKLRSHSGWSSGSIDEVIERCFT